MQEGVQQGGATVVSKLIRTIKLNYHNYYNHDAQSSLNNNVSSYLLPCCMNNITVSILVDTGAGQVAVWNKIKPQDHHLKTVTLHRLVGIPISMRASAVIQLQFMVLSFNKRL